MKNVLGFRSVALPPATRMSALARGRIESPLLLSTTMVAYFLSNFLPGQILGLNVSGWLWVGILIVAVILLMNKLPRVSFPFILWLPWAAYLVSRIQEFSLLGVQSTVQILLPVLAAASASTTAFSTEVFATFNKWMKYSFIGFATLFFTTALPWALSDVRNSGWITGGIMALFFQSYFLCSYLLRGYRKFDLICVLIAVSIPVILTLRGPILGTLALCICVIAPIPLFKRGIMATLIIVLGLATFYSPRVQSKMFYTGQGDLLDLRKDNQNLNTSGRIAMAALVEEGLNDSVWIGHGVNSAGQALLAAGGPTYAIHNDWLRIRYDSGRLGVSIFVVTMFAQAALLLLAGRGSSVEARVLLCSGASCFIPFVIVMFTDNLLVYCQYFTVPHFLLIGYGYAAARAGREASGFPSAPPQVDRNIVTPPFRLRTNSSKASRERWSVNCERLEETG